MISSHFDKTAAVERLSIVTGNKKAFATHLASVPCLIQPLTDEVSQDLQGSFGKDFLMLSAIVDIEEGDKIVINDKNYKVMGTEALNFGNNPHRESRIRLFTSS